MIVFAYGLVSLLLCFCCALHGITHFYWYLSCLELHFAAVEDFSWWAGVTSPTGDAFFPRGGFYFGGYLIWLATRLGIMGELTAYMAWDPYFLPL